LVRIPLLPEDGLSPEQQAIYDKIASGPRGAVVGPMRAALHSPELADRWQALGEFLRFRSCLPARLSELTILICGRYWNSDVEWYIHVDAGLKAGLSRTVIEAIRSAQPPEFTHDDEAVVYDYTRVLLQDGRVSDAVYQAAFEALGKVGIVELTALVGYYTMVSMTLNAHHVPLPDANPEALRTLDDQPAGAHGATTRLPPLALAPTPAQRKA